MTWKTARSQLATIIEGSTPEYQTPTVGKHFREHDGTELENVQSRGFIMRGVAYETDGGSYAGLGRRETTLVELQVFYARSLSQKHLDIAVGEDYRVLRDRLLDSANWNQPTSTIVRVTASASTLLPAIVVFDDEADHAAIMTMAITLEHER